MERLRLTGDAYQAALGRQQEKWQRALTLGKGNPLATLCLHCYGRHAPPNDELCPDDPPARKRERTAGVP